MFATLCALLGLFGLSACSDAKKSCIDATLMSINVQRNGLVTLFFRVSCDGRSVEGLNDASFEILENGQPISGFESQKRVAASQQADGSVFRAYAMLLVDMSGSIVDSNSVPPLVSAAKSFVSKLAGPGQHVGIYVFDGRSYLEEIVPFTGDKAILLEGLDSLLSFKVVDRSTNLNGAVINGIERLQAALQYEETALLTAGTMVVFTDGTDRAQRYVSLEAQETVTQAVKRGLSVYTIGLGVDVNIEELELLGQTGFQLVTSAAAILDAFDRIADRIERLNSGYYGLAYCSSARGGTQDISVQITHNGQLGVLRANFNAEPFGLGCSTETPGATSGGTSGTSGTSGDASDATSGTSDATSAPADASSSD
jgi:hypothetical protein